MGAHAVNTIEDLEKLAPPTGGKAWELNDGELVAARNALLLHERVKARVALLLTSYLLQSPIGEVMVETGIVLSPNTFRIPDVLYVSNEALQSASPSALPSFLPELVVEVVSDSEKALDVEQKLRQYLHRGIKEVWQIFPSLHAASITTSSTQVRLYSDDLLTTSVLPGFSAPVSALFP